MQKLNYRKLKDRADAYDASVLKRVRIEVRKAGLHPEYIGTQLHNAMISYRDGKPWREVNYHHARRAVWLLGRRDKAQKALDKLYDRKGYDAFDWSAA